MGYKKKTEPGFLIMYDWVPNFRKMSSEQVGRFVLAMADYASPDFETKVVPDFSDDPRMDAQWIIVQPSLDRNKEHYQNQSKGGSYAGWCSSLVTAGKEYLKVPREDYIQAGELYEDYLERLPEGQEPQLFNDWLSRKRHRDDETGTSIDPLPWGDP